MRAPHIRIARLDEGNAEAAFSLVCRDFSQGSAVHRSLGVSKERYAEHLSAQFQRMLAQGLSLVAVDGATDAVVGCLLACDYARQGACQGRVPDKLQPLVALFAELDRHYRCYRPVHPGQIMLVDLAVVTPCAGGRGIYSRLREVSHATGRAAGFRWVVGELSSAATQHVCVNKLGHRICAEIEFASFEYQGTRPFAAISEPASIVLVEGALD